MKYVEQLERVRRYFKKFQAINDGSRNASSVPECVDEVYAFFQNCYHLKDWLKNDPMYTKHSGPQIEDYVSTTAALAVCADLCNATKHLELIKPPRSGSVPTFGTQKIGVNIVDGPGVQESVTVVMQFEVKHGASTLDAFQIATDAFDAWERFLA